MSVSISPQSSYMQTVETITHQLANQLVALIDSIKKLIVPILLTAAFLLLPNMLGATAATTDYPCDDKILTRLDQSANLYIKSLNNEAFAICGHPIPYHRARELKCQFIKGVTGSRPSNSVRSKDCLQNLEKRISSIILPMHSNIFYIAKSHCKSLTNDKIDAFEKSACSDQGILMKQI